MPHYPHIRPNYTIAQGYACIAKRHIAKGHATYAANWAQASVHQANKAVALAERFNKAEVYA